ncbi:hypothetical protein MRX96_029332 [Rhipicephalus microplus]
MAMFTLRALSRRTPCFAATADAAALIAVTRYKASDDTTSELTATDHSVRWRAARKAAQPAAADRLRRRAVAGSRRHSLPPNSTASAHSLTHRSTRAFPADTPALGRVAMFGARCAATTIAALLQ